MGRWTSALFPHSTTRVEFRKDGITTAGTTAKAHLPPGTFITDPTAKPKALDLTAGQGGTEVTCPAVFDVAGDFLNIDRAESSDGPRPTQLGEGKAVVAITPSRVKDSPGGSVTAVTATVPYSPRWPHTRRTPAAVVVGGA